MMDRKMIYNLKKRNKKDSFKLVNYNIEAEVLNKLNKTASKLSNKDKRYLKWKYRWNLLKKELIKLDADIYCLNEVQNDVFNNEMKELFICKNKNKNYSGIFTPRLPEKLMTKEKYIKFDKIYDTGCAIFFNTDRFRLIQTRTVNMPMLIQDILKSKKIKLTKTMKEKIKPEYGGIIIILEDLITNKKLCVTSVHLSHKPSYDDLKVLQAHLTLKEINKMTNSDIPLIITGDFNSTPDSITYRSILTGKCDNKFNFEIGRTGEYPLKPLFKIPSRFSKYKMTSVYKKILKREPKYTNYTKGFKDCLDYIFINNKLNVISILEEIPISHYKKYDGFPNKDNPSDHIPLMAEIKFK